MRMPRANSRRCLYIAVLFSACATGPRPTTTPVSQAPEPVQPIPPTAPKAGSWEFRYAPGSIAYHISRTATIENSSDSSSYREISTNLTHTVLSLEGSSIDTLGLTAVTDSFAITTQARIGSVQPVQLPIRLTGVLQHDALILTPEETRDCTPARSVLAADLHNLFPTFPAQLQSGMVWKDSITVDGCQAGIPTRAAISRSFTVTGEVEIEGQPTVLIERADSILAEGEGAQQQHRITLGIKGTGRASYYLAPASGRVLRLSTEQNLRIAMSASGHLTELAQNSQQQYSLVR